MDTVLKNINQYQADYLIIDGTIPIVTNSSIEDEMTLYNLTTHTQNLILTEFKRITNKTIVSETDVNTLSYGQKIIFSVLCSIFCSAKSVLLRRVESSVDTNKLIMIKALINLEESKGRKFLIKND